MTTERNPFGRCCQLAAPLALLLMPYALARYALEERRARRSAASRADPNCVWPGGVCTCGEPEGHTAPPDDRVEADSAPSLEVSP